MKTSITFRWIQLRLSGESSIRRCKSYFKCLLNPFNIALWTVTQSRPCICYIRSQSWSPAQFVELNSFENLDWQTVTVASSSKWLRLQTDPTEYRFLETYKCVRITSVSVSRSVGIMHIAHHRDGPNEMVIARLDPVTANARTEQNTYYNNRCVHLTDRVDGSYYYDHNYYATAHTTQWQNTSHGPTVRSHDGRRRRMPRIPFGEIIDLFIGQVALVP